MHILSTLKDRCLFWLHPPLHSLPPSLIAHTKQRRTSACWPYYCRREKTRRSSACCKASPSFPQAVKWSFCSDDTSTYISTFSLTSTQRESVVWFGSPKFLHTRHCNFPINSVLFVFDPVCWRGRFASFNLSTVSKKRRLNIFWIREKMHPATDDSATYAFGRFVTISIQPPPASLSPWKWFMNGYLQTNCCLYSSYKLSPG